LISSSSGKLPYSERRIRSSYLNRRDFFERGGVAVAGGGVLRRDRGLSAAGQPAPHGRMLENVKKSP